MSSAMVETKAAIGIDRTADSAEQLISELKGTNTLPLWCQMTKLNPPAPNARCVPHVWRYEELRPHLLRAGVLITEKQAERRVLMLVNPGRGTGSNTTLHWSSANILDRGTIHNRYSLCRPSACHAQ